MTISRFAKLSFLLLTTHAHAAMVATDLRCEYQPAPLAVDVLKPRLSWVLESDARGEKQTAYHILVAASEALLREDRGDLWDSGRVESSGQNQIAYSGKPLAANSECFWKVQVWDRAGKASAWSAPASWSTGLLKPEDWKASWIGLDPEAVAPVEQCPWVWFPEGNPAENAPEGKRFFRKRLTLPAGARVRAATLFATADNQLTVHINAHNVGGADRWEELHRFDLAAFMRPGDNVIGIEAVNPIPSPAGLVGKLVVALDNGSDIAVPVDASWKCSDRPHEGWTAANFDDGAWVAARELGAFGMAPWGRPAAPQVGLPMFRREFQVAKPLRRAVVHVCGLGHHDLFLNGRKVGDHFLDPAWTVFEKTLFYSSHDITAQLKQGGNAFGVMLGKGFYNTAGDRRVHGVNADRPLKLILQAHLFYEDGTQQVIASDASWRAAPGPITHSAILGGEDYDARAMPDGWDTPGFADSRWRPAVPAEGPGGELRAAVAPPIKKFDVFKTVRIDEPEPGIFVYDLGQNASAIPRLRVAGPAGQKVKLTPAEQRHGMTPRRNDGRGLVNPAGVGHPNYWEYTLRGGAPETWEPQFNYSGFQYLQIEGAVPEGHPNPQNLPVIQELVSVHVRSSAAMVGRFETSEPMLNAIDRNIDWAVRSNLSHVLTDCPHREKLGWLEVAYLMGPSIAGRYDLSGLYAKIARDCRDSQRADGRVPTVAPAYPNFGDNPFTYTPEWGAAAVVVPWQVHRWYGDLEVLAANFEAMRGFVRYMRDTSTELVPIAGLGDWYDYNTGGSNGPSQFTPPALSAMATFYRCARIVADTAGLLGNAADQREFSELADRIRDAFYAKFFDGAGEYKNSGSPQCANSMALVLGLVPPGREAAVLDRVIADLRARGNQQTAGDVGFTYLIEALERHGRHDVLHDIVSRTEMGSYGFIINNGWTALPEAWDANTGASMNHCMLGHIQQWFLGSLAGIRPEPLAPGFSRFVISPEPVGTLTSARGEYKSVRGRIASAWEIADGRFKLAVTLPANTTAEVFIPAAAPGDVHESGGPAASAPGVKFLRLDKGKAVFEVGSGRYEFTSSKTTASTSSTSDATSTGPATAPAGEPDRAVLDFLNLRFGMFIHFGMSTFHGEQWAYPFRDPKSFRPSKLDAAQWARAARAAGMRYAVFTTKHHDGFCLWPTRTTGYNSSKSDPGIDVVRAYVDAFRAEGLQVGLYYSVMDWHQNIDQGSISQTKVQIMKDQLTELLTQYGPITCIVTDGWGSKWGGPGFGELPFPVLADHIHALQPDCLLINHACAADLEVSQVIHYEATHGQHCTFDNVLPSQQGPTLQSAWFWNPGFENETLKPAEAVVKEMRFANARYCNYLLNCAPNKDGLMDDNVLKRLEEIGKLVHVDPPLTALPPPERPHRGVTASSSSATPGNEPARVLDANLFTRWIPAADDRQPWLELDFGKPETFNAVVCGEYAHNIRSFRIEAWVDGSWREVLRGGDMKHHFQASFPEVTAQRYRLTLLDCNSSPWLAEVTFIRY